MAELDPPSIQIKLAGIRATLQRLGNSLTEDVIFIQDQSSKSLTSSLYKNSSPSENPDYSLQWNSYVPIDDQDSKPGLSSKLLDMHSQEDSLLKSLQIKSSELISLRHQLNSLENLLHQRDLKISKLISEQETYYKAEEQMQLTLQELIKENTELKELNEINEIEKTQLERELKESLGVIEKLKRTLKFKEDVIVSLNQKRTDIDKDLVTSKDFYRSVQEDYNSPTRFGMTERNEGSYKVICFESMKIVGVSSTKDLYPKLLHLRQYHSKYKKLRRLVDRISDMIVQCSPTGSFRREPSNHQIWKWITSLIEEYMKIKKSLDYENLKKLLDITGAEDIQEVISKFKGHTKMFQ